MAGRGPAPKDNRRRRNVPARGEWVDLPPLTEPILAPLPEGPDWPAATIELWGSWRADPVSAQWSPADIAFAADTIRLHAASPVTKAAEIRLRMDALGLTPKGKRDLRWRVGDQAAAEKPALAEVRQIRAVDAKAVS